VTAVLLPRPRTAVRHPAVRAILLLLVAGPSSVAWWGAEGDAPIRLRVLGMLLAAAVALAWDEQAHAVIAASPVGLPAVRRGRVVLVTLLAGGAFVLGWAAVPGDVPAAAVALQSTAIAVLLLVVVAWFGRDGDPVSVVPFPALLLSLAVLARLPADLALLRADPRSSEWAAERVRWWVLLGLCALLLLRLQRDPAAQRARSPLS